MSVGTWIDGKSCPRIDVYVHSLEIRGRGRARTQPQPCRVPVAEGIVAEHARSVVLEQLVAVIRRSPALLDLRDRSPSRLVAGREPSCSHPVPGEKRAVHDERGRSLWVGRREERGHRRAFGVPDYCCSLRPDRVEDRAYVIHPGLKRGYARHAVREAGTALVEQDQAAERCEPPVERRQPRLLPAVLDVRDESGNEDEVERTVARDLIGDVDLTAPGIARLRSIHGHSLYSRRPQTKGRSRISAARSPDSFEAAISQYESLVFRQPRSGFPCRCEFRPEVVADELDRPCEVLRNPQRGMSFSRDSRSAAPSSCAATWRESATAAISCRSSGK